MSRSRRLCGHLFRTFLLAVFPGLLSTLLRHLFARCLAGIFCLFLWLFPAARFFFQLLLLTAGGLLLTLLFVAGAILRLLFFAVLALLLFGRLLLATRKVPFLDLLAFLLLLVRLIAAFGGLLGFLRRAFLLRLLLVLLGPLALLLLVLLLAAFLLLFLLLSQALENLFLCLQSTIHNLLL